jgi:uncharacterized protein (TIGR02147 family)
MEYPDKVKNKRLSTPVFIFDDYVDYLRAWYGYARRFRVTQKSFIERAGVGTQAYFSDILARRKKLAVKHIDGFVSALELTPEEAVYFSLLVAKEHAEKGPEKEKVHKRLVQLRENHLSTLVTDADAEYFSSWKYPVIREYIVTRGFVASLRDIKKAFLHFTMSIVDVRRTVNKLVQWKMAEYTPGGGVRPSDGAAAVTFTGMPHAVVNDVKRLFIESSIHAMETLPREERHISMAVKGVSRKKYELFCSKVDRLRAEFLKEDGAEEGVDYVYGLNVQLFPLMSVRENSENDGAGKQDGNVSQR